MLRVANEAETAAEFEAAVEMLGAMGATDALRTLRDKDGMTDASDPERQKNAIHELAIAGEDEANAIFLQVYRDTDDDEIRDAALEAMLIADYDEGVLELIQASQDAAEKRKLLEMLVAMDSDAVWDVIDATLEQNR